MTNLTCKSVSMQEPKKKNCSHFLIQPLITGKNRFKICYHIQRICLNQALDFSSKMVCTYKFYILLNFWISGSQDLGLNCVYEDCSIISEQSETFGTRDNFYILRLTWQSEKKTTTNSWSSVFLARIFWIDQYSKILTFSRAYIYIVYNII